MKLNQNLKDFFNPKSSHFKKSKVAALLTIVIVLTLNVVPVLATNLREVPVVGPVVDVLTGHRFVASSTDGQITLDISVPTIEGAGEIGEELNAQYLADAEAEYQRFMENLPAEGSETWNESVIGDYEIIWQDEEIVVIKNWMAYTAGSGVVAVNYDVVDITYQLILNLPSLFKDQSYVEVISAEIIRQMRDQMKDPTGNTYWIDPENSPGGEVFSQIDPNQSFYVNAERQLVIAFSEYEVAPGYVGTPEFVIGYDVIKDLLVSDRYVRN